MFPRIWQTFGTSNEVKLLFRAWMHYFGVPKLRKWFRNEINHSAPLDASRRFRVFRSISQTFSTSKEAKLVIRAWMHYFRVPKLRKWFCNEINQSTTLDPQMMFKSVSEHFANLQHVKRGKTSVFGPEYTISGYRSWENGFAMKSTILPHSPNDVWECFWAFHQPSASQKRQNLYFERECTISRYRSCKNGFAMKSTIPPQ